MILIISEVFDESTNSTVEWILSTSQVVRVNRGDDLKILSIDYKKEEALFEVDNKVVSSCDISGFWYRRGIIDYNFDCHVTNPKLDESVYHHLNNEWNEVIYFFTDLLKNNKSLGSYLLEDRKLKQLSYAGKVGLKIPKSFITTSKKKLVLFKESCKNEIITKSVNNSPSFSYENISLEGYTEIVTDDLINSLPNNFFPSFFQENITKQYELRIFFLKGKLYSMAIFSQSDEQTKIDMRKYNDTKPNRTVPYQLPNDIEFKLNDFMKEMNLNTGSIDMIVDTKDEFYFLEVNPNGQFGMVSTPCNYYIEKEIAEILR